MAGHGTPSEFTVDAAGLRLGIAVTRWHANLTEQLLDRALAAAKACHVTDTVVARVSGSVELPVVAQALARTCDAVVALGVVIRGETAHFDFVCGESARGIQDVQLQTGVPCAFGVITCDTMDQALARAGGDKRDQGRNAALTVARMALLKRNPRA